MSELDVQIANRRQKRDEIDESGVSVYPHRFVFDLETSDVKAKYDHLSIEELEEKTAAIRVALHLLDDQRFGFRRHNMRHAQELLGRALEGKQ